MQGPTHAAGGVTATLAGYAYLYKTGSPLVDLAPVASLLVMYPFGIWGSTASDLDHSPGSLWDDLKIAGDRSGNSLPSKDPVSRTISHILHLTKPLRGAFPKKSRTAQIVSILDCKHRSWQTHSEVPILVFVALLTWVQVSLGDSFESGIYQLVLTALILGVFAHLILDLLTPEGLPWALGLFLNRFVFRKKVLPERIKIVPHMRPAHPGEPGFTSTGGPWEKKIVYNLLRLSNWVLMGYVAYLIYQTY